MRTRVLLCAIVAGLLLRAVLVVQHTAPRGDVLLDVGVARSLAQGAGFRSGFDRGTALVSGAAAPQPQDFADQHPPLWPLLGAALASLGVTPFGALKLWSWICGAAVLLLVGRHADRLTEGIVGAPHGLPALASALVALSFVMIDASGNGSLYMAQALLVLLLVQAVAAPQPHAVRTALRCGLLLGAAWLLNYQCFVLLPVPLAVLLATATRGERLRATGAGLLAIAVAAAVQLPWWWRNAALFGAPFFSTNVFYLLNAAGIEPTVTLEAGRSVARLPEVPVLHALGIGLRAWMPGNVLYLLGTGLMLWPGLVGLLAAGLAPLLRRGWLTRDRRLLCALLCLFALLAIALLWPGMKLRYCVPLTPLVVLLGVRLLAAAPSVGERRGAWLAVAAWVALLLLTLGDLTGTEADARPERWQLMALGGAIFFVLPLVLRHTRLVGPGLRLLLCSGLLAAPLVTVMALLPWPHTAYHSSVLTPDVFGNQKEAEAARAAETAARAHLVLVQIGGASPAPSAPTLAPVATPPVVAGPVELLAFPEPALITLPTAASLAGLDAALAALVDAGRVGAVLVYTGGTGWPEGLKVGETWLNGRLAVVAVWLPVGESPRLAGAMLSVVQH